MKYLLFKCSQKLFRVHFFYLKKYNNHTKYPKITKNQPNIVNTAKVKKLNFNKFDNYYFDILKSLWKVKAKKLRSIKFVTWSSKRYKIIKNNKLVALEIWSQNQKSFFFLFKFKFKKFIFFFIKIRFLVFSFSKKNHRYKIYFSC